jgi:Tol biopolymer transport system component
VVSNPNQDIAMGWSPDGRHLLFASDRTGSMGLWAVPVHDGKPQGQPELLKANIGTFESSMGVTASGALYFGRTGRIRNVEIVPVDWAKNKLVGLPSSPIQRFIGSNASPSWSADGKYISYVSLRGPSGPKVLVTAAVETGQVVREVHPKMSFLRAAEMSPDGRSFTAQGNDLKGRAGIFRVDAESGEVAPLAIAEETPAGDALSPIAPADDKSLFLARASRDPQRGQSLALFEKDLTSGSERLIIRGENLVSGMRLSPDRQWIVAPTFDRATKAAGVLLVPVRGGQPRELIRAGAPVQFRIAGWTPDGGSAVIWKNLTGDWKQASTASEVWMIPIDGREPRRVELDLASLPAADGFHFSPDGRYIAYDTNTGSVSEVSMLENFLPALGKAK